MDKKSTAGIPGKERGSRQPANRLFVQKVSPGVTLSILAKGHERSPGPFFSFPFLAWLYPHETEKGFHSKHYMWVRSLPEWTIGLNGLKEGVILAVTRRALQSFCPPGKDNIPKPVTRVLINPETHLSDTQATDSINRSILFQLRSKSPDGFEIPLLYKKLALQLLANELDAFAVASKDINSCRTTLSSGDMERLEKSRLILEENLEFPPGIKGLARMAGLNEHKLKTGFKHLFGDPPMAYLRRVRMKKAKELLQEPGVSVTQAALQVGYSNPSAFSASFLKHHGYPPGRLKKTQ